MSPVPTLTTAFCRVLTDYLSARGQPLDRVLAELGISLEALAAADGVVPRSRFNAALELAIRQTGDAFIGLHAGERIRPAHYGVLGYVLMSCETSRQVIERHRRWHQLVARGELVEYEEAGSRLWMRESMPDSDGGLYTRPSVECVVASAISFARWVFGREFNPVEIHFPHPAPPDLAEYARIFRCALRFDAPCVAISIHSNLLDLPLPQADPELRQLMEARAARQAAQLGIEEDPFLSQLRRVLAQQLPQQVPSMASAAAALNISERTLQRRLGERHTHFKGVLDDTRRRLALQYLHDPQLSLVDIAFLLGFSEQSAFNRAFRRWTGRTPGEQRAA